ncbi:MAG: choice-of-anchor J domain-containing protein [Bacteroidetes bacterium]|nr:choice-of-anchor J domain-containing protein [Bacteroidota bacterium]
MTTPPWSEGFEGVSPVGNNLLPQCWSYANISGNNYSCNGTCGGYTAHTGVQFIGGTAPTDVWNFTPAFQLTAGTPYEFSYWFRGGEFSTGFYISVAYGMSADPASMVNGINSEPVVNVTQWTQRIVAFTPAATGVYYFGLHDFSSSNTGWAIAFDDFKLEAPVCPAPSALTATGYTATSENLGWTPGGNETSWDVEYGIAPFAQGTGTVITGITAIPYNLQSLTPNAKYAFYVRGHCPGGTSSPWAGPQNFTMSNIVVTVTNGASATPNLAPTYPSLASALNALNSVTAMNGPVTLTLAGGASETAPTKGLTIGSATLNAVLSATNTVTILSGGGVVTLNSGVGTATPANPSPDGILKIVGADYITISGLTFTDGNTTNPATMEFGVGMFKSGSRDGAQHNTISNCTFNMQRANFATGISPMVEGSAGILVINSTPAAATWPLSPTTAAGANSANTISYNTFNNGNYGVALSGYAAATPFIAADFSNEVSHNTILNFGGGTGSTNPSAGILANNQWSAAITYNTINNNNGSGVNHPSSLRGIYAIAGTSANITISSNTVTLKGGATTYCSLEGINNGIGYTAASNTVTISGNTVENCTCSTSTSVSFSGIVNAANAAIVNVYGNIVRNNSMSGNMAFTGINAGDAVSLDCYENSVYGNSKSGPGSCGSMVGLQGNGISSFHDNVIYSNTISTSGGTYLSSSIYGCSGGGAPGATFTNNQIHDLSITGSTTYNCSIYGIYFSSSANGVANISLNSIHDLNITCIGGGTINGYYGQLSGAANFFKNKICTLTANGSASHVSGMEMTSYTNATVNVYNNIIGNLFTPTAQTANSLAGIYIEDANFLTCNLYYNTVYLNATSSGALFGSSAIYASTNPTVTLRNNIFVNTSTRKGSGITCAYRRSGAALATYGAASDNNFYYAGIPSAANAIFYDGTTAQQTLANFQALVAPRDNVSLTSGSGPSFISTSCSAPAFLHINAAASVIESGGAAIAGFDSDFDGNVRQGSAGYPAQVNGGGSAPDIGADEYDGIPNYTCNTPVPGNTVTSANNLCNRQTITLSLQNFTAGAGVRFQWQSSPDGSNYTNITGANTGSYTTMPVAPAWFRCLVTCLNGPVSATSTPVHITIANSVLSTTPGSTCGIGPVSLAATGNSGTTLNWYATPTGMTSLGSGSPFTTPPVSSTTTFYVGAEVTSPESATVGTGTGANYSSEFPAAYGSYVGNARSQYLITAADLVASGLSAGNLTSVAFDVTGTGSPSSLTGYTIKMGTTAVTWLSAFQTVSTVVYGPTDYTPVVGSFAANTHAFSVPFAWDGFSNLIVDICFNNNGYGWQNALTRLSTTSYASSIYYGAQGNVGGVCGETSVTGSSYSRPNMRFGGTAICSSPRSPVVATFNPPPALTISGNQIICSNDVYPISVTTPAGNFDTYAWTPATNLFTDSACTIPYAAPASATTVYVKSAAGGTTIYTCTATSALTGCINTAQATVTVMQASPLVITPAAPVIAAGAIQSLTATGGEASGVGILSENFNGPANNWTTVNNSTSGIPANAAWTLHPDGYAYWETFHSNDNSQFYMSNRDAQGAAGITATELISPVINTMEFSSVTLTFWQHYFCFFSTDSHANVDASTDGGATWDPTPLASYTSDQGGAAAFVQATVDLSAYTNQSNLKIRFRYTSTDGYYWCIDNVSITGTAPAPITWSPGANLYSDNLATVPYAGEVLATVYAKPATTITYTASGTTFATGCVRHKTVTVTVLTPITLSGVPVNAACPAATNGSIDLTVSAGTSPYTYLWSTGSTLEDITGLGTGTYSVTVTDAGNSTASGSWVVGYTDPVCNSAIVSGTIGTTVCRDAYNTITVSGLTVTAPGGSLTLIAGQNILIEPGTHVENGSYLWAHIYNGTWCPGMMAPLVAAGTLEEERQFTLNQEKFLLYPNPTTGNFTLVQKGEHPYKNVNVEIYSIRGERVIHNGMIGERKHEFSMRGFSQGVYFVKIVADDHAETIKLVKTR